MKTVSIKSPLFVPYQLVNLHWNGVERKTKIVKMWFDFVEDVWMYELDNIKSLSNPHGLFPESVLTPRQY